MSCTRSRSRNGCAETIGSSSATSSRVRAEVEVRVESVLEDGKTQLLDPSSLLPREGLSAEIRQRLAAEKHERRAKELALPRRAALPPRLPNQRFETPEIDLVRAEPEEIARRARFDHFRPEQLPERRDVPVQGGLRRVRLRLAPEGLQQHVGSDNLIRVEQERSKQRTLLRPSRSQILSAGDDLEGPQDSIVHLP